MAAAESIAVASNRIQSRLTLEHGAYGLIVLLAAALRLWLLGEQPMSPAEAEQAWAAVTWIHGDASLPPAGISPLLMSLQLLTFLVAQPSEALARLWPAVAGTLMVLLPYGLRRELGRLGALLASLLLAISASLTFWSRSATGESFALFATLALLVGLVRIAQDVTSSGTNLGADALQVDSAGRRNWLAATLALLLISAPLSYSAILALLALGAAWLGRSARWPKGLAWAVPAAVFVAVLVLGSTAFLVNPGGLAAAADLPATWLHGFVDSAGYSWIWLLLQFVVTEPLLTMLGLAGLVLGLRRRKPLALALGLAAAVALVLAIVRAGRTPADVALLVLPLALLGGQALGEAAGRVNLRGMSWEAGALLVLGAAILGSSAIWLADYANSGVQDLSSVFLVYGLGVLALLVPLLLFYWFWVGGRVTWQVGLALLLLALLVPSLRATLAVSQPHDGQRWNSPLHTTGATDGRNVPAFLEQVTRQDKPYGGDPVDLQLAVVTPPGQAPSSLLLWYLRDAQVSLVPGAAAAASYPVVASLAGDPPALGDDYSGRSFRLAQSWTPQYLSQGSLWRWLIYGKFDDLLDETRAIIWVRNHS